MTVPPLNFSGWPRPGWKRVERFAREYLRVPKGTGQGRPFILRPWQVEIVKGLYPYGRARPRQGLLSLPRGNGKSALAAVLALYGLYADDVESPQVVIVASNEQTAGHVFKAARRMIELSPALLERTHILKDAIRTPLNNGEFVVAASKVAALQGFDPSLQIVDELHVVDADVWEAVTSAAGKRPRSLTLAISTPSDSQDSVMHTLVKYGRQGIDASFYLKEYAAPEGCAVDDREAWRIANPALGDFQHEDALAATLKTTREAAFRRYRLGQWVGAQDTWLPFGAWDKRTTARELKAGEKVCLGFDGSASGDSTALVACTLDGFVSPVGIWNKQEPGWRVPRAEVTAAVDLAFDRYDVVELAADPWGWRSEIEDWSKRHGERRVVEYNTAYRKRMGPATDRLYAAVMDGSMSHDGDRVLSLHVSQTVAGASAQGAIVSKDSKNSPRKIDAAVAAIVAFDRATFHSNKKPRRVVTY